MGTNYIQLYKCNASRVPAMEFPKVFATFYDIIKVFLKWSLNLLIFLPIYCFLHEHSNKCTTYLLILHVIKDPIPQCGCSMENDYWLAR